MLKCIILLLVLLIGSTSKKIQILTNNIVLNQKQEFFLTKMYIQQNGHINIKIITKDILNTKYKIYAYQQQDYYSNIQTIRKCQDKQKHIYNKRHIDINADNPLSLKQKKPHFWYFTLANCQTRLNQNKGIRLFIELTVINNDSHLETIDKQLLIIQIIKLIIISSYVYLTQTFKKQYPNFIMISIFVCFVCLIFHSIFEVILVSIKYYNGQLSTILSSIQELFNITIRNAITFILILLLLGWKSLKQKQQYLDLVSPFIICKGTAQLILFILYLRQDQHPEIFVYQQSFYFNIQLVFSIIFFVIGSVSLIVLKNEGVMRNKRMQKIYLWSFVYWIIIPLSQLYLGWYIKWNRIWEIGIELWILSYLYRLFKIRVKKEQNKKKQ